MTALVWDQIGDRIYQTGIDRGVLFIQDEEDETIFNATPWNGLIGLEESSNAELKSFYLDGVKYLENLSPGDFIGKLKAFTYPDEFESVMGVDSPSPGLHYHEQPPKPFSLTYRTKIGNDIEGTDFGYRIHILYDLLAVPDSKSFDTYQDASIQPIEFSWSLTGTPQTMDYQYNEPVNIPGVRPTCHISIDSINTPPEVLETVETLLYGEETVTPTLPSISIITALFP